MGTRSSSPGAATWRWAAAAAAAVFGVATIVSGGRVLFGVGSAREAAGHYLPPVVAFNFAAGFGYLAAAAGLALRRRWSVGLAVAIAGATVLVFAALGVHVATGGAFEQRTVVAMAVRSAFWIAFAVAGARLLRPRSGSQA